MSHKNLTPVRLLGILALVFGLSGCAANAAADNNISQAYLIENVTAIDATNGIRKNVAVLVKDKKIQSITSGDDSITSSAPFTRIDGSGKFLIPGLWDAHVHLAYNEGLDHQTFFPLSLAYGVTSLRDTGGHLDLLEKARSIADSDALTPNLFVSGPLIDGKTRVYAGQSAGFPNLSVGVGTKSEVTAQVDSLASQGVTFLKAYEMLSPEVFAALVAQARHHKLPVTGHSPLSMTAKQAIESGINDMQHLRNLEMDCATKPEKLLMERQRMLAANTEPFGGALRSHIHREQRSKAVANYDKKNCDALIAAMVENGVSQTPTLTITTFLSRRLYADTRWRETFKLVPPEIAVGWQNRSASLSKRKPTEDDIAYQKWVRDMVVRLDQAGVPIMAGTDAPIGFLTPGASLHEELALLVEAGLSPMAAIRAATYAPAAFFGLEGEMGLLQPGMVADLVLLNANPLSDIRNTANIDSVFKDGRLIGREQLDILKSKPSLIARQAAADD